MANLSDMILPSNRAYIDRFLGSGALLFVDTIIAGVYVSKTTIEWDEKLFGKFKRYVVEQEDRWARTLKTVKYYIDSPTTLNLLIGPGRHIEQVECLPPRYDLAMS